MSITFSMTTSYDTRLIKIAPLQKKTAIVGN